MGSAESKAAKDFVALWESGANDRAAQDKLESILGECELAGRMIYGMLVAGQSSTKYFKRSL